MTSFVNVGNGLDRSENETWQSGTVKTVPCTIKVSGRIENPPPCNLVDLQIFPESVQIAQHIRVQIAVGIGVIKL